MSTALFLDKPLLKVSRPVAACSRCRTAKIKCDGKLPACSACERVGKAATCSSASDEFARGKERSYVASLEAYCERLEKRVTELRQRKELLISDDDGVVRESSITSAAPTRPVSDTHRREVSDIDDLVGDFGYLSVSATSRDFHGITSNTSFANLLLSVSLGEPIPRLLPQPLPPRHEITPLVQHYFDTFFSQLPFFPEVSFWASVDIVYQKGAHFAKPFDNWILRMVLATAYASMSNAYNDKSHQKALALVSEALQYAEDVLRPGTLLGIQAIMFLAQYSLVDPNHFRSWYLVGMAARALVDLGIHQDHHAEAAQSVLQQDLRRRVFHCLFILDRATSTAFDRTFSFSDQSVHVALPSSSSSPGSSPVEQSHIFLHSSEPAWSIVRIRQILSAAYQRKYFHEFESPSLPPPSTWILCSQVHEWYKNTPQDATQYFPILYRLEYLYTTIIILSPSSRHLPQCNYTKFLLFKNCIEYVRQLHQVLESQTWLPVITFLDIQRTYQISRKFIDILTQDFDLIMSQSVPALPQVPDDCPTPPLLDCEDCLDCYTQALECLTKIGKILQFGVRKWKLHGLRHDFQQRSTSVQGYLLTPPAIYTPTPPPYMTVPPTVMSSTDMGYRGFGVGQYES
ncbi:hypothetical protein P175DRAFT_0444123 [Aspergillus ochraceoroseus IBT 24754]|uniref:Zn(2)-C6 fungal-type domain-containing protein n=3 Tax=Aspergillus subgen. Nidulantes TaxID=2720870 RepID=A0A0F8X2Z0_9EURO|nr:uncharacterized protein P175DRAFT_0444123 [Aspergillus ochraceoroseus IBT 24754]KKK24040.1 hypothetical protein ARAM_004330 [Aspergillus rambellii]PTU18325.1 hypothetical protein P175DRAFT_0444123 [Aspergillus ochraceoroseus IBT 24754]